MALLEMWVVYDRPADHPEAVVARRWEIEPGTAKPTEEVISRPELEAVREELRRKGLTSIPRGSGDDPVIVEVWV